MQSFISWIATGFLVYVIIKGQTGTFISMATTPSWNISLFSGGGGSSGGGSSGGLLGGLSPGNIIGSAIGL